MNRQHCGVPCHLADVKLLWRCVVCSATVFDVTSSCLRLHTPAQVWAHLQEAVQLSPSHFFTDPMKSIEGMRFRGADRDIAF